MSQIVTNRNTSQTPITTPSGANSLQSIRYIPAPRVYIKTADVQNPAPVQNYYTKSNGATPSGWTDLGIVDGVVKVNYDKKVKEITTGIDQYLRAAYVNQKVATFEFDLGQADDYALAKISGLTGSVISAGSTINFQLGQEDLNQVALLLVNQNKLDGKEWQFYNPNAFMNFVFNNNQDALTLKVTGFLPLFTASGQTTESILSTTIFV